MMNLSINSSTSHFFLSCSNSNSSSSIFSAFLRLAAISLSTSIFYFFFNYFPITLLPKRLAFVDVQLLFFGFWEKNLVGLAKENNHQVVVAVLTAQAVLENLSRDLWWRLKRLKKIVSSRWFWWW